MRSQSDGITVKVLGDYGPFSMMGKSIGYQVTITCPVGTCPAGTCPAGSNSYLVDCGTPLFQQMGGDGLKTIQGLIITHCHDDHKRWFSDLALFHMYAPDMKRKVFLLTSETVKEGLFRASGPALETSLTSDSRQVADVSYGDYIDFRLIGPRARYRIKYGDDGTMGIHVSDMDGNPVAPGRAKVIISNKTGRHRLLFKDPHYEEWVEPGSFYPFSSDLFYDEEKNIYRDPEGFTIEAINAPVWHGVPAIGVKFKTGSETLIFSSDTVHDRQLWEKLYSGKRTQRLSMTKKEFEAAPVIYGDINDYIERTWSRERFEDAVRSFEGAVVIHDITARRNPVHTNYRSLKNTALKKENSILTHSPDTMTSEWVLSEADKVFRIKGDSFYEVAADGLHPFDADIYHKESGRYYVGYKNESGNYIVYEQDGLLSISRAERPQSGKALYRVDLYEDIGGRYYPKIENKNALYRMRADEKVELVKFDEEGSRGEVVEDLRERPPWP